MRETLLKSREAGETLALTWGCFDLFHAGHWNYLNFAQSLADRLVILLDSDEKIRFRKGIDRPADEFDVRRSKILSNFKECFVFDFPLGLSNEDALSVVLPDVLVLSSEDSDADHDYRSIALNSMQTFKLNRFPGVSTTLLLRGGRRD